MSLPIFQSPSKEFSLMQTAWASELNPFLNAPICNGLLLVSQVLTSGDNTINHKLGRKLIGWIIVGQNASATFYDKQAANQRKDKTLVLNASGAVTVNIWVF